MCQNGLFFSLIGQLDKFWGGKANYEVKNGLTQIFRAPTGP